MGPADIAIASLILAGAFWLLYRSVWKRKGFCHGCAGDGCRPRPRDRSGLVRLGRPGDRLASPGSGVIKRT
ncbi:MAG TPA: FeoB-associated Cys-rich membrane protein [Anaeromyxobacteraceae bacterium]|nr:FeoB-associated Cys-rich membrane protein [Anaeromyxobacteraceae bacterium]